MSIGINFHRSLPLIIFSESENIIIKMQALLNLPATITAARTKMTFMAERRGWSCRWDWPLYVKSVLIYTAASQRRVLIGHSVTKSYQRSARYKRPYTWTNPQETHLSLMSAVSDLLRWGLTNNKEEITDLSHFDYFMVSH